MEDEYFHKFRESLDYNRDFDFDENEWSRLSNRLKINNKPSFLKRLLSWKTVAASIVFLLFSGNILLWKSLSLSQKNNDELLSYISKKSHRDTVVIEKWTTIVDTVKGKQSVVKSQAIHGVIPFFNQNRYGWLSNLFKINESLSDVPNVELDSNVLSEEVLVFHNWTADFLPNHALSPIEPLSHNYKWLSKTSQLQTMNSGPSNIQKVAYFARPKGILVGGDFVFNIPFSNELKQEENSGIGLRIEVPFTNSVSFWTVISGHFTEYSSDFILKDFSEDKLNIPTNFEFVELKVIQKYKQFMIGLKYDFVQDKNWNPFLSFGFGLTRKMQTELIYDFVDTNTGLPIRVKRSRLLDDLEIKNVAEMRVGLNYDYSNRLLFHTNIGYRLIRNDDKVFYKSGLNFGTGILYHF